MNNSDFFRHCWLTLKLSKPRLRKFMDEIECTVEGAGRIVERKRDKKKDNEPDDTTNRPKSGVIV